MTTGDGGRGRVQYMLMAETTFAALWAVESQGAVCVARFEHSPESEEIERAIAEYEAGAHGGPGGMGVTADVALPLSLDGRGLGEGDAG